MYYFIVNPKAGAGAGLKKWKKMKELLDKKEIPYEVYFTDGPGSATEQARRLTSRGEDITLIALGGDGTANEALNGIVDFSHTVMGYLPTGSSNDLARALRLPTEPEEALALLTEPGHAHPLDVGEVCSETGSRRFLVSAGIGFDAAVCHEAFHSRIKKALNRFHLGKLTYLGIALKHIILLKGAPAKLLLDGREKHSYGKIFFCSFMNTMYEGGGFKFCPEARPDDGLLDVFVVEQLPKLKILAVLPMAYSGKHTWAKEVHISKCKKVHIKTPRPMAVHTDGEAFDFHKDLKAGFLEERLRFLMPH